MTFLPKEQYKQMLAALPILCVDIIMKNSKGEFFLIKRTNEPMREEWCTVGGRVSARSGSMMLRSLRRSRGCSRSRERPPRGTDHRTAKSPY